MLEALPGHLSDVPVNNVKGHVERGQHFSLVLQLLAGTQLHNSSTIRSHRYQLTSVAATGVSLPVLQRWQQLEDASPAHAQY